MLNITLSPGSLQGQLDVITLSGSQLQSSPVAKMTHKSPGPGGPFSVFLSPGDSWYSPGNAFRLTLQTSDGNLVLQVFNSLAVSVPFLGGAGSAIDPDSENSNLWVPVWSAKTNGKGVTEVDFQIDGNLVAYAGTHAVWASNTSGSSGRMIIMQDDGNLVIYKDGPTAVWATNTSAVESKGFNA